MRFRSVTVGTPRRPPADDSALPGIGFRICYVQQLWIEGTRAMQDEWYGDKRDVVKWSSLVHLARREQIRHILHVAMYRSDMYPALGTAQGPVELPIKVVQHFCDLNDVQRLATATGRTISTACADGSGRMIVLLLSCSSTRTRVWHPRSPN